MFARIAAACVALLTVAGLSAQRPGTPPSIVELLDAFNGGNLSVAREVPSASLDAVARDFERLGAVWITSEGAAAIERRRLAATTLALELSRPLVQRPAWGIGRRLVSWGCAQWRAAPSQGDREAERRWLLASVALLEAAEDYPFLTGWGANSPAMSATFTGDEMNEGHLAHATTRFPDEPRFAMAAVVVAENRAWTVGASEVEPIAKSGFINGMLNTASAKGAEAQPLKDIANRLVELSKYPPLLGEIHVRYGLLSLRFRDSAAALAHFRQVEETTTDPYWRYLGRLLSGYALERQGQNEASIAAYRSALELVPRAQSAVSRLAGVLFKANRRDEAAALAENFFANGPPADPWRSYRQGDGRLIVLYMAQLRESLR